MERVKSQRDFTDPRSRSGQEGEIIVMAFIPMGAHWYVADVILEFTIEGDPRNLVHINTHLIEADSPDQAYQKANELGRDGEHEYDNPDGKRVRIHFRGLRELCVIHDDLEDGAELFYEQLEGLSEDELRRRTKPKEELSVFTPRRVKMEGPNYMPEEVMKMLELEGYSRDDVLGDDAKCNE